MKFYAIFHSFYWIQPKAIILQQILTKSFIHKIVSFNASLKMIKMQRQLNLSNKNLFSNLQISFQIDNKNTGCTRLNINLNILLTVIWAKNHFIQSRHLTARYEANPIHFPFSTQNIFIALQFPFSTQRHQYLKL